MKRYITINETNNCVAWDTEQDNKYFSERRDGSSNVGACLEKIEEELGGLHEVLDEALVFLCRSKGPTPLMLGSSAALSVKLEVLRTLTERQPTPLAEQITQFRENLDQLALMDVLLHQLQRDHLLGEQNWLREYVDVTDAITAGTMELEDALGWLKESADSRTSSPLREG